MADPILNLVVLRARELDRTAWFYHVLFGVHFSREKHEVGPEHMAGRIGPILIELYPITNVADTTGVRLGFKVDSMDDLMNRLDDSGGVLVNAPKRGETGLHYAGLRG